ncbi:MAG: PilZ domain-containing protein [Myxococcales bacterium]|nr:PilZ domain-containing protein [Myxococcales bacterium]MDH3486078.1 PilZ domain-containing protein [Myxococcales bacterium]
MNTSVGYYQAPRPPRVPLDEVLIRLYPEGFHEEEFEADGLNVGPGGISMRASVLPQVGSTLRCQLESPIGGAPIQMVGRVVWAHDSGPQVGEFGIRFTRLSDEDQTRIEALIQRWGRSSAEAPSVRLRLDGVGSPIVAELASETDTELAVEQSLPFLAIGSAVENETAGRRGHLEAVELKFDERTPKLVLNIGYETEETAESASEDLDRDTLPDDAPRASRPNRRTSSARIHDTPRIVRYDSTAEGSLERTTTERLRDYARAASDQLSSSLASVGKAIKHDMIPSIAVTTRRSATVLARFVEALRGRLDDKPRRRQVPRSQAARAHLKNSRRTRRRYLIIAALAFGIVMAGWGIYLWAASGTATASGSETETASAAETAAETASASEAASASESAATAAPATASVTESASATVPLPPERVRGMAFGAEQVPGGEKYVLRMSNPVTAMDGLVEDDGFSVMIPGSLSLSRAGPIATAHPDVEHAGILNRGDFSELTIRFVAGRHPAYRVEARGPAIELTIAR